MKIFDMDDKHFYKISDLVLVNYSEIETNYTEKKTGIDIGTGFRDLDRLTLGLRKGDLIVVAAARGIGKTIF